MADLVRVISWNLAYGKPAGFKTIANRRRQWALLGAVAADVVLLQECRPSDLRLHAPAWMADEYQCVGVLQQDWRLCASMLVRQPHVVEPLDLRELGGVERRWLEHLPVAGLPHRSPSTGSRSWSRASMHSPWRWSSVLLSASRTTNGCVERVCRVPCATTCSLGSRALGRRPPLHCRGRLEQFSTLRRQLPAAISQRRRPEHRVLPATQARRMA